jgi:hypothetical protein
VEGEEEVDLVQHVEAALTASARSEDYTSTPRVAHPQAGAAAVASKSFSHFSSSLSTLSTLSRRSRRFIRDDC